MKMPAFASRENKPGADKSGRPSHPFDSDKSFVHRPRSFPELEVILNRERCRSENGGLLDVRCCSQIIPGRYERMLACVRSNFRENSEYERPTFLSASPGLPRSKKLSSLPSSPSNPFTKQSPLLQNLIVKTASMSNEPPKKQSIMGV